MQEETQGFRLDLRDLPPKSAECIKRQHDRRKYRQVVGCSSYAKSLMCNAEGSS
jgi:hypothetical protein